MRKKYKLSKEEVHEELVKLLKIVDEFLRENNIEYSISYGSLLGAVRHKGFIPWDDDIDISIKRSEYNKLLEILRKNNEIADGIICQGVALDNLDIPFLKVVNTNIESREEFEGGYIDGYLWVDIFPADNVPKHFKKLFFFWIYKVLRKNYYFARCHEYGWESNAKKCLANTIAMKIAKRKSGKYYAKKLESLSSRIKESEYISNNVFGTSSSRVLPKEIFDSYRDYQFENITVKGVSDYATYLKINYGDYMKLPKESERRDHGLSAWKYED